MRLIASTVVCALACGAPAFAQEISGGVKGGVGFSKVVFSEESVDIGLNSRTGVIAGGFLTWPVTSRFDIQPEVLFAMKGSEFDEVGVEGEIQLNYLDIPVLFRYRAPASATSTVVLFGGPSLGLNLSADARGEFFGSEQEEDISDEVTTFDFGIVIGAGFEVGRFTIDGRYTWGLTNINDSVSDPELTVHNRAFAILAGFRF